MLDVRAYFLHNGDGQLFRDCQYGESTFTHFKSLMCILKTHKSMHMYRDCGPRSNQSTRRCFQTLFDEHISVVVLTGIRTKQWHYRRRSMFWLGFIVPRSACEFACINNWFDYIRITITSLLQSTAWRRPPPMGFAHSHHAGQGGWWPQWMLLGNVVFAMLRR